MQKFTEDMSIVRALPEYRERLAEIVCNDCDKPDVRRKAMEYQYMGDFCYDRYTDTLRRINNGDTTLEGAKRVLMGWWQESRWWYGLSDKFFGQFNCSPWEG